MLQMLIVTIKRLYDHHMAVTMVPQSVHLPDVLPTDRLNDRAMPVRPLRDELRRIPTSRNVITVVLALLQTFGVVVAAVVIDAWGGWRRSCCWAGVTACSTSSATRPPTACCSRTAGSTTFGRWLLAYPTFQVFFAYRRAHFAHHRDELGPDEPDRAVPGLPDPGRLVAPCCGATHWVRAPPRTSRPCGARSAPASEALQILGVQIVLLGAAVAVGEPLAYVVWIGSWSTLWKVSNRLRAIAEHGGMERSPDRRRTTHVIRQGRLARFCMVPYNTGWHLAHHVDMGVPWRNLPRLHDELVRSGCGAGHRVPGLPGVLEGLLGRSAGRSGLARHDDEVLKDTVAIAPAGSEPPRGGTRAVRRAPAHRRWWP